MAVLLGATRVHPKAVTVSVDGADRMVSAQRRDAMGDRSHGLFCHPRVGSAKPASMLHVGARAAFSSVPRTSSLPSFGRDELSSMACIAGVFSTCAGVMLPSPLGSPSQGTWRLGGARSCPLARSGPSVSVPSVVDGAREERAHCPSPMELRGYRGAFAWLPARTVFLTRHGSHAYGLATTTSDLDVKGIAVPPRACLLGFVERFEQAAWDEPDTVIFALRSFVELAAEAQPNVLEVLFTDPGDHLGVTPLGERLLAARDRFVSKRVRHTFGGYAMALLRRLERHHRWRTGTPPCAPRREDFGLAPLTEVERRRFDAVHAAIERVVRDWEVDLSMLPRDTREQLQEKIAFALAERVTTNEPAWRAAARHLALDDELVAALQRERVYQTHLREWQRYLQWKHAQHGPRADSEVRFGYDTKAGVHVLRLLRMCREILTEGKVRVRRPDREELLAVRNGAWSFERLREQALAENSAMDALWQASRLPPAPDRHGLDALCVGLTEEALRTLPEA